jgi:hypothetical protein
MLEEYRNLQEEIADLEADWNRVSRRRASTCGIWKKHKVPKSFDTRRLLLIAYTAFITYTSLFEHSRQSLRRQYPELALAAGWQNEYDQIYARAVIYRNRSKQEISYLRDLHKLSGVLFGKSEYGLRLTHSLVRSEPECWTMVAQGAIDAFDGSELRGHGSSGGLRLKTFGDVKRELCGFAGTT